MPVVPSLSGSKVLLVTAVLNGIFCVSQGIASQLSHSLALLGDSIDMAADTVTYSFAYCIERRKELGAGQLSPRFLVAELAVASLSGLSLIAGSCAIIRESARRHAGGEAEEEEVNSVVIFGFAGVNFVVNGVQLVLFLSRRRDDPAAAAPACCNPLSPLDAAGSEESARRSRRGGAEGGEGLMAGQGDYEMVDSDAAEPSDAGSEAPDGDGDDADAREGASERGGCCANINVGASLAHVVADTLRTFSELTAAFIIQVFETDSVRTDAVAAIVINVTILASGLYICYEVAVRARVLWGSRSQETGEAPKLADDVDLT